MKTPLELCRQDIVKPTLVHEEDVYREVSIIEKIALSTGHSISDIISIANMLETRRITDFKERVINQKDEQIYGLSLLLNEIIEELRNLKNK